MEAFVDKMKSLTDAAKASLPASEERTVMVENITTSASTDEQQPECVNMELEQVGDHKTDQSTMAGIRAVMIHEGYSDSRSN